MAIVVKRDTLQSDQIGLVLKYEFGLEGTKQFLFCADVVDSWGEHRCLKDNEKMNQKFVGSFPLQMNVNKIQLGQHIYP